MWYLYNMNSKVVSPARTASCGGIETAELNRIERAVSTPSDQNSQAGRAISHTFTIVDANSFVYLLVVVVVLLHASCGFLVSLSLRITSFCFCLVVSRVEYRGD